MIKQPDFKPVGPADWGDKPLVILGAGPSLKGFDLQRLNRPDIRVLAVKQMIFHAPFAEIGIGMDHGWVHKMRIKLLQQKVPVVLAFPREDNPSYPIVEEFTYHRRQDNAFTLSRDPELMNIGGSSGSAAVAYAALRGARKVLLLGFDYCSMPDATLRDGNHYLDSDYPWFTSYNTFMWPHWAKWYDCIYDELIKTTLVYNASPISIIKELPRLDFEGFMSLYGSREAA